MLVWHIAKPIYCQHVVVKESTAFIIGHQARRTGSSYSKDPNSPIPSREGFIKTLWRVGGEGNGTPLQYCCLENPMDGGAGWAAVHGVTRSRTQLSDFTLTFHFHALEKEMATHSSVLAWRIPGTGEPSGLPSMGSHRVGHDWSDLAAAWRVGLWGVWSAQAQFSGWWWCLGNLNYQFSGSN